MYTPSPRQTHLIAANRALRRQTPGIQHSGRQVQPPVLAPTPWSAGATSADQRRRHGSDPGRLLRAGSRRARRRPSPPPNWRCAGRRVAAGGWDGVRTTWCTGWSHRRQMFIRQQLSSIRQQLSSIRQLSSFRQLSSIRQLAINHPTAVI